MVKGTKKRSVPVGWKSEVRSSMFRVRSSMLRVQGSKFRVQCSKLKAEGNAFPTTHFAGIDSRRGY